MANYVITNSTQNAGTVQVAITANSSQGSTITVVASTISGQVCRGKVYDMMVGTIGTPADSFCAWSLYRVTTIGGSTATSVVTGQALDPADSVPRSYSLANSTTMGTVASSGEAWYVGVNQRASYRWVAAPGSEIVWPATSSNGVTLRVSGTATVTPSAAMYFQEQ